MIDMKLFKKKLALPEGFNIPIKFKHESIEATPLTRNDLDEDLEAVNSSLEIIRDTRGGTWPEEELDRDFDLLDLAWHEREFRDGSSFAYVLRSSGKYIGCLYIYPIGERIEISEETLDYDADFSWWVTQDAYDRGLYEEAYLAIKSWEKDFPFSRIVYSNKFIPKEK